MFSFSLNIAPPLPFTNQFLSFTSSAPSKLQSGFLSSKLAVGILSSLHNKLISYDVGIAVIFKFSSFTFFAISFIAINDVEPDPTPITSPSFTFSTIFLATFNFSSKFEISPFHSIFCTVSLFQSIFTIIPFL